jgi:hypothetical protein
MPPNLTFRALIYGVLTAILVLGPHPVFASPSTQTLHFPRNAKRVYPKFKKQLKKIAKHLKQNPEAILVVTGHTDDTGPERVNRKLSLTRARWIREQLVKLGISEDRITIRGVAHDQPVASGKSPKARKKNRRVEFEIVMEEVADPTEALADAVQDMTEPETPAEEISEEEVSEEVAAEGEETPDADAEASEEDGADEEVTEEGAEEAVEEPADETPEEDLPAEEPEAVEEPEPLPVPEQVEPLPALDPVAGPWYTEPLWINTAVTTTFLTTSISLALASSASASSADGLVRGTAAWDAEMTSAESRATAAAWMYGFTTVSALLNGWLAYEKYVSDEEFLTPYLRFDPSGWFGGVSIDLD